MWGIFLHLLGRIGINPIPCLAYLIGTNEPALNLLISILMGYPLGFLYHKHVRQRKEFRDLYFLLTGLDMAFFNFGITLYHSIIPVLVMFLSTKLLGKGKENVILTFIFNMGYLVTGYVMTESENYDITWTMPHCVLTLKLIALSFDLWDGEKLKKGETLSATNKQTAIIGVPTLLELLGFVYFPACFLVGPIFSFRRYSDFKSDKFPLDAKPNVMVTQATNRFLLGIMFLVAFQIGVSVFNMNYMMSDEFYNTSVVYRHFYCGMWAQFALYKYISCWLLTEASCIRFGLAYNGIEKMNDGTMNFKWDGCINIKLWRFLSATKFQHYIDSFNCNTNHFAAEYVYKRLKFLGNRNLSQLFTLMFLALWHGTRSGYYMTFFNEFLIILMEKGLESVLIKTTFYQKMWSNSISKYVLYTVLKVYTIVFMGWSLAPFDLKIFSKWWHIYSTLYFSGFILFLPWSFVYKPALVKVIKLLNLSSPKTE